MRTILHERALGLWFPFQQYGGRDGAGWEAELQLKTVKTTGVLF